VSRLERPLLIFTAIGILAEVATGINAALQVQRALIIPFTGL
jgi:hypothetical protein